jgi:predicted ATPase/class 3 adenylate cyclase
MADGTLPADGGPGAEPAALTFFFSDIEGSTRLAAQLGTQAFAQALDGHRALVREAFGRHGGREVSTGGDSFFAVFTSPSEAVAAAVATQRALARPIAPGVEIRIRVGLHVGHAVRIGDDYLGLEVNRAARVADAGHGGQILVSDAARVALGVLAGGLALRDLGRHRLKDVGPERLWQVEGPDLPTGPFPPPRSLDAHPSNLPAATAELVGRAAELSRLAELVEAGQVVTVVGAGGIGKSRLAIEVARSLIERFPDGVFYLELASVPTADLAAAALLDVLGLPEMSDGNALEVVRTRLRDRDLLLLLDTTDRVAGADRLVASLAAACPHVRLLVTSRTPLRIAAERELLIGPLPADDGARMFEARARAVQPGWEANPASLAAIDRLVARLDGIPLAIELAAARVRILTPAAILDRLERRLPALAKGPSDLPDRQRTLDATIGWSHEQLNAAEGRLFARLAVFVGPFGVTAIEGVAGEAVEAGEDALGLLERLVDRSLVTVDRSSDETLFRLLGPIRDFAADALRRSGEDAVVRRQHATYHLGLVQDLAEALERGDDLGAVAAIERVEPELRAALEWALGNGATILALDMAGRLGRYWWVRGRVREGVGWLERALASVVATEPTTDRPTLARALYWAGVLLDDARRSDEARARLESALTLQLELGDERAVAGTLNSLGVVARSQGQLERATELLTQSLEGKRRIGDERGVAVTLSNLGIVASDRGDHDRAAELMAEALTVDESSGSASGIVVSRVNLGSILVRAGRTDEGLEQIRRALPGIGELGDPELVAAVLTSLSHIRLAAADPDGPHDAARLTLAGEELRRREGIPLPNVEQDEADDLLRREAVLLGPEAMASIRAEASVTDLDAALRLAIVAAGLPVPSS